MSATKQKASIYITSDEFIDLIINVEESLATLNESTTVTLRSVNHLVSTKKSAQATHTFQAILTIDNIYEYQAEVELHKTTDGNFSGTVVYSKHSKPQT